MVVDCEGWSVGEPHVILEMSQLSKTLATNFAGKRFFSSMNSFMNFQVPFGGKALIAIITKQIFRGLIGVIFILNFVVFKWFQT